MCFAFLEENKTLLEHHHWFFYFSKILGNILFFLNSPRIFFSNYSLKIKAYQKLFQKER